MHCSRVLYSDHALSQMFKRDIDISDAEHVIISGEIIRSYLDDKPYPSYLILGYVGNRALHLVIAKDLSDEKCIIVTAYEPDPLIWESDFKVKKK